MAAVDHLTENQSPGSKPGERGLPLWVWGFLSGLALWLLYVWPNIAERLRRSAVALPPAEPAADPLALESNPEPEPAPAASEALPAPPALEAAPAPDKLTVIDGIGPAIAARLNAAGVWTYADLAQCRVEQLREIVRGVGLGLADPTTWPEQARYARRGDWDGLRAFKARLPGRRQRPPGGSARKSAARQGGQARSARKRGAGNRQAPSRRRG